MNDDDDVVTVEWYGGCMDGQCFTVPAGTAFVVIHGAPWRDDHHDVVADIEVLDGRLIIRTPS